MPEASQLRPPIVSALAQALDRVVPEPMTVEPYRDGVRIRVRGQGASRLVEVWDADVSPEDFAVAVLGAAQDEVIEEVTHNGWPPADSKNPEAPQFGAMLPRPRAEVASGVLRCWYGDPDNPALTLDDVPLDRL